MFIEFDELESGHVTFGDASKILVKGKDKILIHLKNGNHQFISNVYCVLDKKNNILSLGQVLENGYDIHMRNQSLSIRYQHVNLIANVLMTSNRMFLSNNQNDVVRCLKSCVNDSSWIWHLKYIHLNFGNLKLLSMKNLVRRLPPIDHPNHYVKDVFLKNMLKIAFQKKQVQHQRSL